MEHARSVHLSPAATPTSTAIRREREPFRDPQDVNHNSFERGVARDASGLPYLDTAGSPIGLKQWGEEFRTKFEKEGLA